MATTRYEHRHVTCCCCQSPGQVLVPVRPDWREEPQVLCVCCAKGLHLLTQHPEWDYVVVAEAESPAEERKVYLVASSEHPEVEDLMRRHGAEHGATLRIQAVHGAVNQEADLALWGGAARVDPDRPGNAGFRLTRGAAGDPESATSRIWSRLRELAPPPGEEIVPTGKPEADEAT